MARELAGWKCTQCHVLNEPTAFQCFRCGRLREGVVVQAVLPDGAGENLTLYEGTATGPAGSLLTHARCTFCNGLLRPDWVACPRCGTKTFVPETQGLRGVLNRVLPWVVPVAVAALALAGTLDLLTPQKITRAGNIPMGNSPRANTSISPEALAQWMAQFPIGNAPAANAAGNTPTGNHPAANHPAANTPSSVPPSNVPPRNPANTPAPAANVPAAAASHAPPKSVDPAPRSAVGDTGLVVKDVKWVDEGGLSEIKGTIKNPSDNRYRFVRFTFDLLDSNGASVGTVTDSVTQLRRRRSKDFSVLVMQSNAVRCRLKSVEAD